MVKGGKIPEPAPKGTTLESRINDVVCRSRQETELEGGSKMVDATTSHAVNESGTITPLDAKFPNQFFHTEYDRAKVGVFFWDPEKGPMIELTPQVRPALAFAPQSPRVVRLDISDIVISRETEALGQLDGQLKGKIFALGSKTPASSGQTDLYYHFAACQIDPPSAADARSFVTLAEAIRACREGHGDAQTEALCERLADNLGWIPNLGMTVDQARQKMSV